MIPQYNNISYKAIRLIEVFKSKSIDLKEKDFYKQSFENLTSFEYLYVLNEILLETTINLEVLEILFDFTYLEGNFYEGKILNRTDQKLIDFISYRTSFTDFLDCINDFEITDRIIYLLKAKNEYWDSLNNLKFGVLKKINLLSSTVDIVVPYKKVHETYWVESNYYVPDNKFHETNTFLEEGDIQLDFVYKEVIESVFNVIQQSISEKTEIYDNQRVSVLIDTLLEENCKILKSFSFNSNDYKFQMLELLLVDVDEWKSKIYRDLTTSKTNFYLKKEYYINCLKEFKKRTSKEYVSKIIDIVTENNIEVVNGEEITTIQMKESSKIDDLINWIEGTFESPRKIKKIDFIKASYIIPTHNRINLSPNISQPTLLNLLKKFLCEIDIELKKDKIDSLKSFISNLTVYTEKVHHKKLIDKIPYQKINYIPQEHFKDFVKIFLVLKENSLIISTKKSILDLFVDIFYIKEHKVGYSYDSLKTLDIKISKNLKQFRVAFISELSSIKREYKLP